MHRNVSILIIVLVVLVIAGYLVWLRNRLQPSQPAASVTPIVTPAISQAVSISGVEATASVTPKVATPSPKVSTSSASFRY